MTGRVCRSAFRGMAAVGCSPGPRSSVRRRRWQALWPGSGPGGWLARSRRTRPASWPADAEWRSCWCRACSTGSLFHDVGVEGDAVEDGGDEAGVGKDGAEAIQSTTRPTITDRQAGLSGRSSQPTCCWESGRDCLERRQDHLDELEGFLGGVRSGGDYYHRQAGRGRSDAGGRGPAWALVTSCLVPDAGMTRCSQLVGPGVVPGFARRDRRPDGRSVVTGTAVAPGASWPALA